MRSKDLAERDTLKHLPETHSVSARCCCVFRTFATPLPPRSLSSSSQTMTAIVWPLKFDDFTCMRDHAKLRHFGKRVVNQQRATALTRAATRVESRREWRTPACDMASLGWASWVRSTLQIWLRYKSLDST